MEMGRRQEEEEISMKVLTSFALPLPLDIPVGNACGSG